MNSNVIVTTPYSKPNSVIAKIFARANSSKGISDEAIASMLSQNSIAVEGRIYRELKSEDFRGFKWEFRRVDGMNKVENFRRKRGPKASNN